MSTRMNIKVSGSGNQLWLYRHHDGYPACGGTQIAQVLKKVNRYYNEHYRGFAGVLQNLLDCRYPDGKQIHEITTGEHGDIEWKYVIQCRNGSVSVQVFERKIGADEAIDRGRMTLKQFRSFCAKDLLELRKRIKEYKARRAA